MTSKLHPAHNAVAFQSHRLRRSPHSQEFRDDEDFEVFDVVVGKPTAGRGYNILATR